MILKRTAVPIISNLLAVTVAAMIGTPTYADGIYITGVVDCGKWVEGRSTSSAQILEGYVIGMMNGLALGSGVEFWFASGSKLEAAQVHLWMDKYCRENPLSSVVTGTVALMNEHTGAAYSQSHN